MNSSDILTQLAQVLEQRKGADPASSYTAKLWAGGATAIGKKIGEEAVETAMAGVAGSAEDVVYETADLWFHSLVLLSHHGLAPQQVLDELARRFGVSGLDEKASREAEE